jgi:hypothetical protein
MGHAEKAILVLAGLVELALNHIEEGRCLNIDRRAKVIVVASPAERHKKRRT